MVADAGLQSSGVKEVVTVETLCTPVERYNHNARFCISSIMCIIIGVKMMSLMDHIGLNATF